MDQGDITRKIRLGILNCAHEFSGVSHRFCFCFFFCSFFFWSFCLCIAARSTLHQLSHQSKRPPHPHFPGLDRPDPSSAPTTPPTNLPSPSLQVSLQPSRHRPGRREGGRTWQGLNWNSVGESHLTISLYQYGARIADKLAKAPELSPESSFLRCPASSMFIWRWI